MKSYNNAFEILTDDPVKLEDYEKRSNLMNYLVDVIKGNRWNSQLAMSYLGASSREIEILLLGCISKLSLQRLNEMRDRWDTFL